MHFDTPFAEYLYQYSDLEKSGPINIRVIENLTESFLTRNPDCRLESWIWDAVHPIVRVYWPGVSLRGLSDWTHTFTRHGQPVPLLDILEEQD